MQPIRVLIVNCNPNICDSIEELFEKDNRFAVCSRAYSADAALAFFKTNEAPDVALIDMLMPICDGTGLVIRLREEKLGVGTMLIGLTSFLSDTSLRMIQCLNLSYIIAMPSTPDAIYKRVCALLQLDFADKNVPLYLDVRSKQARERDEIVTRYCSAPSLCTNL